MRKVVLGLGISLDGYIARLNGDIDFLIHPKDYSMGPFFASVDAGIMGRKTLEDGLRMSGGKLPKTSMKMYVMSRTKPPGERDGVIFVNEPPAALAARLHKQKGKNIWLMGGGELAREFLRDDLVDEMCLGVVPVLLGEGIPLFPSGFPQRNFKLIENKTYSQGLIALKYERARGDVNPKKSKQAR
ncbi:MAG: dihydrofolate reductase family protein [Candidatus Acidiferrales bacterium]